MVYETGQRLIELKWEAIDASNMARPREVSAARKTKVISDIGKLNYKPYVGTSRPKLKLIAWEKKHHFKRVFGQKPTYN